MWRTEVIVEIMKPIMHAYQSFCFQKRRSIYWKIFESVIILFIAIRPKQNARSKTRNSTYETYDMPFRFWK